MDQYTGNVLYGKKWTVCGDRFTPVMIRSMNPDICDEVKQIVKLKQAVDYPSNTHPNDKAHEYESYFIESFLRRI